MDQRRSRQPKERPEQMAWPQVSLFNRLAGHFTGENRKQRKQQRKGGHGTGMRVFVNKVKRRSRNRGRQ